MRARPSDVMFRLGFDFGGVLLFGRLGPLFRVAVTGSSFRAEIVSFAAFSLAISVSMEASMLETSIASE